MKKLALIEEVLKIAGVKLEIDVCRQFWKLLWHKISSQDINQTLGEMKERTKYYTNLPTKCVLGNNFFQEIFNSSKNLFIFPETYKWIWAGV